MPKKGRKTFEVEKIRNRVNEFLKHGDDTPEAVQMRMGQTQILEEILFATGNYKGFRYLTANEVLRGQRPGIRHADDECTVSLLYGSKSGESFYNCDESRKHFY